MSDIVEKMEKLKHGLEKTNKEMEALKKNVELLKQEMQAAEDKFKVFLRRMDANSLLRPEFRKKFEDILNEANS